MKIIFLTFGQVANITGGDFEIEDQIQDTDSLKSFLENKYPELASIKFALAVNKKIVQENMDLNDDVTIALLPPFSGG